MNSRLKVQVPFLKQGETVGLGDAFKKLVDPKGVNTCQACERRRLAWNALVSFTGTQSQPPVQQPRPLPSDYRQMYHTTSEDDLPEGGE